MSWEPVIHSHITDELASGHPLAHETVRCVSCDEVVHAENNECMQTWVETGRGPYCLPCWIASVSVEDLGRGVLAGHWAIPEPRL